MEGFWVKIAVPIATLIFYIALAANLFKIIFILMIASYIGYLIFRRQVDISTFKMLNGGDMPSIEIVNETLIRNSEIALNAKLCRFATWFAIFLGCVLMAVGL